MKLKLPEEASFFIQLLLVFAISIVGALTSGFLFGGFDTQAILDTFQSYGVYALAGTIMLVMSFIAVKAIKTGDAKFGDSLLFASQGQFPALGFLKRFTKPQLFLLFIIILFVVGLFGQIFTQQAFFGALAFDAFQSEQQFTPTGETIFSTFLIPASENLFLAGIFAVILVILGIIARKKDLSKIEYQVIAWFLIIASSVLFWISWHSLRYAGSDKALLAVGVFGFTIAILTLLSGSFILAWILHIVNNLYLSITKYFSNEQSFVIGGIVIALSITIYIFLYRKRLLGGSPYESFES